MAATQELKPTPSVAPCVITENMELENGRYKLLEKLGAGGHGVVFKALETGHSVHRYVAIKFLNTERTSGSIDVVDKAAARFQAEAHIAGRVQHPNVIQIYSDGCHQGQHFYVMEYLADSRSLSTVLDEARIAKKPIPFADVKAYFIAIARGLRAIHRLPGVFHRDIKLHNILLAAGDDDEAATVKIIDFGIAHNPDLKFTQTGCVLGTQGHVAPECGRCDPATKKPYVLDNRVDLFALGVALYQFATFETPFDSSAESIDPVHVADKPSSKRSMPLHLESVIMKLLAKDRDHRYRSCDELLADLGALDPNAPVVSAPAGSLTNLSSLSASLNLPASASAAHPDDADLRLSFSTIIKQYAEPAGAPSTCSQGKDENSYPAPLDNNEPEAPSNTPDEFRLTGAAAQHAKALETNPKPKRLRLGGIKRRERLLIGMVGGLTLCGLFALKVGRKKAAPATEAVPVTLPKPNDHRSAITPTDILHDARERRTEFIERQPPAAATDPAPALATPMPKRPARKNHQPAANRIETSPAAPTPVPPAEKPRSFVDKYESVLPDSDGAHQNSDDAANAAIPAGTQARALLSYGLSSNRPNTMAEATLVYGLSVRGRRVAEPGAKLLGKAHYRERDGKWFVEIDFDRLVSSSGEERKVTAIATQGGAAGVEGRFTSTDKRTEAATLGHVLRTVGKAAADKPASDLARELIRDQDEDLREMRRRVVTVTLPRKFAFEAQFVKAS